DDSLDSWISRGIHQQACETAKMECGAGRRPAGASHAEWSQSMRTLQGVRPGAVPARLRFGWACMVASVAPGNVHLLDHVECVFLEPTAGAQAAGPQGGLEHSRHENAS